MPDIQKFPFTKVKMAGQGFSGPGSADQNGSAVGDAKLGFPRTTVEP